MTPDRMGDISYCLKLPEGIVRPERIARPNAECDDPDICHVTVSHYTNQQVNGLLRAKLDYNEAEKQNTATDKQSRYLSCTRTSL